MLPFLVLPDGEIVKMGSNEFDPKWVSHPPVPLAHDDFVNRAPWMHSMKDWDSPEELPMPKW